ncbi:MAG: hypothetical protein ACK5V3_12930 [Bdellovibrionales bacterium]
MNKILFALLTLVSTLSRGEEEKGPPAAELPSASSRAQQELIETEKQVSALTAKVNAKQASIDSLLKQKQIEKDPEKVTELIKLLQQEHRDWSSLIQEHNSKLNVLKYRFPERGASFERKYKRFNPRSLDQMEESVGIEKQLHLSREKVKKVYGVSEQTKKPTSDLKKKTPQQDPLLKPKTISN